MRFNNFGRFTIFIAMFSGAVAFASPFFAVYELKDLNLSYIVFVILGISASISSLLSMTFWGRISDKYGTLKVMKVTGFFIGLIPILWISSIFLINNFYLMFATLFIMELFNGLIWAGFNLSAGNFIYNSVTQERIGICTSYYNLINAVVVFVFATLGGLLANANFSFTSHSILIVFAVSGILRFLAYFLFFHKIKENPYENSIQKNETLLQLTKEFLDKVRFEKLF
jgi:MFS family permease